MIIFGDWVSEKFPESRKVIFIEDPLIAEYFPGETVTLLFLQKNDSLGIEVSFKTFLYFFNHILDRNGIVEGFKHGIEDGEALLAAPERALALTDPADQCAAHDGDQQVGKERNEVVKAMNPEGEKRRNEEEIPDRKIEEGCIKQRPTAQNKGEERNDHQED